MAVIFQLNRGNFLPGVNCTGIAGLDDYIVQKQLIVVETIIIGHQKAVDCAAVGYIQSIKQRTSLNCYYAADSVGGAFETSAGCNEQFAIVAKSNI